MKPLSPLLLLLALANAGCAAKTDAAPKARPAPLVVVTRAETRDLPVEVRAPVDLRPLAQSDVGSKTLGYLDAVLVDRGDKVKRGQLLALVRASDLPDQLVSARGSLAQAEASSALAKQNLARAQSLAPSGVVSQQELQQAQANVALAAAQSDAAKAQVSVVATRLGEMQITSPLDGVVSLRRLDPGALVGPPGGGAIVTVARIDVIRVFVTVSEREQQLVKVGQKAHVEVDALPGRSIEGLVVRLSPTVDPQTRTLDVEVQIDNADGVLRPGMYGRTSIVVDTHPGAVVVPATAVQISNGKRTTFVLKGDKVERRELDVGVDRGDFLEIRKGVSAGDEVVITGADAISDGTTVRVVRGIDPFTGKGAVPDGGAK